MIIAIVIAVAAVLGISIIAFSDFGENLSAPIVETGKAVEKIGIGLAIPIILIVGFLIWQESQ